MPESVDSWWARRQRSKGAAVPYEVGQFRTDWERYPVLVRQYHSDLNCGVALTQVPPAADVWLLWQCEVGHTFIATPWEQRQRPGTSRRRSTWCPECTAGATARLVRQPPRVSASPAPPAVRPARALCRRSDAHRHGEGDAFASVCAPARASAVEGDLHHRLAARLEFTEGMNAVRIRQPFFEHLEVWPDIVLPELRVAIEYDSTGRDGLEHVGKREPVDLRKDRMLRGVDWEVIRIRAGKLQPLGPHDLQASTVSERLIDRILDELRVIRGHLFVDCYLR